MDHEVRADLLRQKVDIHDWKHRPSCFKKGCECRFCIPKPSCALTELLIEEALEDCGNVTKWHRLVEDNKFWSCTSTPFLVETRRCIGSHFLNTHSVPVSAVFGCNTNVQMGAPCHLFYTSTYAFKNTQKEDSDRFVHIGTRVCKRLMRMKAIARQNAYDAAAAEGG